MISASFLAALLAVSGTSNVTLVAFSADWCSACQASKPTVQRLITAGYPVREVNVDREPELVARFRVTSVPCFVLVAAGQEADRVMESVSMARLVQMYDKVGFRPAHPSVAPEDPTRAPRGPDAQRPGQLELPRPLASLARNLSPTRPEHPQATAINSDSSQRRALRATVRLRIDDLKGHSVGTGTIIDTHADEALIVTCGHLFRDSSGTGRIAVDLFVDNQPRTVNGTLISYDLERDLALVSIPAPVPLTPARVAPAGFRFERGQSVFSIGCDRAADPSVQSTRITGIDRYVGPPNVEVAGQPIEGRSGGGLFSVAGELIGVCNAADPTDNEGIFASLPAVHWELARIGQSRIYEEGRPLATQPGDSITASPGLAVPSGVVASRNDSGREVSTVVPLPQSPAAMAGVPAPLSQQPPRPQVDFQSLPGGSSTPALAAADLASDDTEVICIVRSRANPQGAQQLIYLDRPSRDLLTRLTSESRHRSPESLVQQPVPTAPAEPGIPARNLPPLAQPPFAQPVVRAQSEFR